MPESLIIPERLEAVKDVPVSVSSHPAPFGDDAPGAFCVMEYWSYVTGQKWTDSPANCCPTIGAYLRRLNDITDQAMRDRLKVWVTENAERIARTANDGNKQARGYLAADWSVRTALPVWLDAAGATEAAEQMRSLPQIVDASSSRAARDQVRAMRKTIGLKAYWEWRAELRVKVKASSVMSR